MQQKIKQNVDISSMSTHKLNENMTIKTNSDKYNMLKDDQDNIQVKELTLRQTRDTTKWAYMSKWVG